MFKKISVTLLIVGFVGYGISKGIHIFTGERLDFSVNKNEAMLYSVEGMLPHAKEITINGALVPTTEDGNFSYDLSPLPGLNDITVIAADDFGNVKKKTYSFIYNNKEMPQVAFQTK